MAKHLKALILFHIKFWLFYLNVGDFLKCFYGSLFAHSAGKVKFIQVVNPTLPDISDTS